MVLIFNLAAGAVAAVAAAAAAAAHFAGFDRYWLVAGFAAMTVLGGGLELHPRPSWHPRYFWIVPAWFVGLVGLGLALHDAVDPTAGFVALGAAAAAFLALTLFAIIRKPGGRWLAGVVGAGAIVSGFQWIGYARPEWKHPVLYGVNGVALVSMIFCAVQLYRARKAAETT